MKNDNSKPLNPCNCGACNPDKYNLDEVFDILRDYIVTPDEQQEVEETVDGPTDVEPTDDELAQQLDDQFCVRVNTLLNAVEDLIFSGSEQIVITRNDDDTFDVEFSAGTTIE